MNADELKQIALTALEDLKARDLRVLDVRALTDVMETIIICCGTSNRHVRSLAENVVVEAKKQGQRPLGVEGEQGGDWVLVDYGDVVVHVMMPDTREFYDLERLWTASA